MDFYETVKARKTIRDWSGREVPEDAIKRMIEAGLAAPSNNHLRSWEFILLHTREEKDRALQFVRRWTEAHRDIPNPGATAPAQEMYTYAIPRQYSMLNDAPYVIIPLFKAAPGLFQSTSVSGLNTFASIWCVIENMFLAAAAEGLACSMRIPVGTEGPEVCSALGVPETYMMPVYIGVGYPAETAFIPEQYRFTAEQKTHRGRW